MNEPLFVGTIEEACKFLRCCRTTLYKWRKENADKHKIIRHTIFIFTL